MIVVRTAMGLLFIFGSLVYFFGFIQAPPMEPGSVVEKFNTGLASTGYFFPVLKSVELICGILFVIGRAVPFATVLIAPVIVNIALWHFLADRTSPGPYIATFLVIANCLVAWYYRDAYKPLFTAKVAP
jgi:putative oxidoreductase